MPRSSSASSAASPCWREGSAGDVHLAEGHALRLDVEDLVLAALERAVLDRLDGLEDRDVDLLLGRGQDVLAQEGLVGVHADAQLVLLLRGVQGAQAALAGHLEDDAGAALDLREPQLLALGLVDEVLRVAVEGLDARHGRLGAGLVARDVGVHGRDLLAADGGDGVEALLLGDLAGQVARQVAGLGLLEEQPAHVLGLALERRGGEVDDGEVRVGEALGHRVHRVGHEEPDPEHQVVLLLGQRGEVRHVVRVRLRGDDAALDAELLLRVLQALVGQRVERAVVQAADVRDEADLDGGPLGLRGRALGGGAAAGGGLFLVLTAACGGERQGGESEDGDSPEGDRQRVIPLSSL
jgi:hypothetical protein